ncbi:tetratricopeptide repeat protein [Undibacterium arcticum]
MNKFRLLPLACSLPVLLSCSAPVGAPPSSTNSAMRIEPVLSIRNSDGNARGLYQLGRYYQGQNRLEQAADAYRKAVQQHADYIEARSALGTIYSTQGKYDAAIEEFSAILKLAPQLAHIYNNLGYTYYLQGSYAEAVAAFDKAIAIDPDNPRPYNNLGSVYHQLGEQQRAQLAFARANALTARAAATPGSAAGDASLAVAGRGEQSPDSIALTNPAAPIALQTVAAGPSTALEATSRVFTSGEPAVVVPVAPTTPAATIASTAAAAVEWNEPSAATPVLAAGELAVVPAAPTTPAAEIAWSASPAVASNELSAPTPVFAAGELAVVAAAPTTPAAAIASTAVPAVEWNEPSAVAPTFTAGELAVVAAALTTPAATMAAAAVTSIEPSVTAPAEPRESGAFATADRKFRMEIANGNGVPGLARRIGATMASQGFAPSRLTNQKPYRQLETTVRYRDGFHDEALRISQQFNKPTRLVGNANLRDTVDVQLVLGKDVISNVALFRLNLAPMKLAKKSCAAA